MTTLVVDPGLFEISADATKEEQHEHFVFLQKSIDFASEFLAVTVDQYSGAPYCFSLDTPVQKPPITKSLTVKNGFAGIQKKLHKMFRGGEYVELLEEPVEVCPLLFEADTITEKPFKRYIRLLLLTKKQTEKDVLLLLSKRNAMLAYEVAIGSKEETVIVAAVSDPENDCGGVVGSYLKESITPESVFPQEAACRSLNDAFKSEIDQKGLDNNAKRAIFKKYGNEVASRNFYCDRADLSRKNPGYDVFIHSLGEYYISIDQEHGAMEIFKQQRHGPTHVGEFTYSCKKNKEADPATHKLVV